MNAASQQVEDLLARLRSDPAVVVDLYEAPPNANLNLLVQPDDVELANAPFLNHPATDGVAELPVFTSENQPLLDSLRVSNDCGILCAEGRAVFRRMLDVVETGALELALNPGINGIRIDR